MASSHTFDTNLFEAMLDAGNAGSSGLLDENENGVLRSREKRQSKTSSSDASAGLFSQSTNDGNGGKITVEKIDQKLTQLAEIVNSFAPVVKELKSAYDAAQQQAEADMSEGEINDKESPEHETNDAVSNALTSKSNEIHDLV